MKTDAKKTIESSPTLRSNYFEMVQAVKEGKQLQLRGGILGDKWIDDYDYSKHYGKKLVLAGLLNAKHLEYRVKPELKLFKYSTRVYKFNVHPGVGLWSSESGWTQDQIEQTSFFKGWVGDTVEYIVEYDE